MHIEFQNGACGDYNNIAKITAIGDSECEILRNAVTEFLNRERQINSAKYVEGELVTVVSEDCRLPKGTLCTVMYTSGGVHSGETVYSYYIRNIDSEYCCWVHEDQIKGVT